MNKRIIITAFALFTAIGITELQAQTTVTFNLNLKPMLEDSVVVPGRGDVVQVTGNLYPLDGRVPVRMRDREPIDSVYTAEVKFPRSVQGRTLQYSYVLDTEEETIKESMYRQLRLRGGDIETDPLYFDSHAW